LHHASPPAPAAPLPAAGPAILLRALFKRRRRAGAGALTLPPTVHEMPAIDPAHVERYNALLGYPAGAMPLPYFYLPIQRAHLAAMLSDAFPFRLMGMLHVENALVAHGAPPAGRVRLSTRIEVLPPTASGAVFCLLATEGSCGGEAVFSCTSKYLALRGERRGERRGSAAPARQATPAAIAGSWYLPPSAGRAYARVSGDWNPIHLARWTARLMGLRRPIIHGMHSVGKACALLERGSGRRVRAVDVRFRAPVPLGASVDFAYGATPGTYALYCKGVLAAEGSFQLW
jgi:acyl dehydratase